MTEEVLCSRHERGTEAGAPATSCKSDTLPMASDHIRSQSMSWDGKFVPCKATRMVMFIVPEAMC